MTVFGGLESARDEVSDFDGRHRPCERIEWMKLSRRAFAWTGGLTAIAAGIAQGADAGFPLPLVLLILAVVFSWLGVGNEADDSP